MVGWIGRIADVRSLRKLRKEIQQFVRMINWWIAFRMFVILLLGLVILVAVIRWFLLYPDNG